MESSRKTVLITGGAGYIGSAIAHQLLEEGHAVCVYDDLSTGREDKIDPRSTFVQGDILDISKLGEVFASGAFDAVIHCAGKKVMSESEQEPTLYFSNNVGGTLNILSCMERYGVPHIIFSSTAAVYAPVMEDRGVRENDTVDPASVYGRSKLMAEMLITDYARVGKIRTYTILRYFNVAGDAGLDFLEQDPQGVFPLLAKAFVNNEPFHIYGTDYPTKDGSAIRDYIHLYDLARAHVLALNVPENEIFNLGTNTGCTVRELVEVFKEVSRKDLQVTEEKPRLGDIAVMYADSAHARVKLHWQSTKTLHDMVQSTLLLYGV